jgi:arylsulfate sulfotransferase
MKQLANGNLFFGTGNDFGATGGNGIYEISMYGEILHSWPLGNYLMHHDVIELPNGNFLADVHDINAATVEDIIVEVDRNSGAIINTLDLKESLNYFRQTHTVDEVDWIHVNSLSWDNFDNTILVSGRTQGVIKLTESNEVKWILGTHQDWGFSGDGVDLSALLLTPLDANDQPITDTIYTYGYETHPDFEFPWFQHAVKRMPNGHYSMFDNGTSRNFTVAGPDNYSRAVEYEIDEENMTVKQIWDYGKERRIELFSRFVSDVDYRENENSFIMSVGGAQNGGSYGKVVEIDYDTKNVIYEATVLAPNCFFGLVCLHRTERMPLYPN